MPKHIGSMLLDFQVCTFPTFDTIDTKVVGTIENIVGSVKFRKVFAREESDAMIRTVCYETEKSLQCGFMTVRAYQKKKSDDSEKVLISVTWEMPDGPWEEILDDFDDEVLDELLEESVIKVIGDSDDSAALSYPIIKRCVPPPSPFMRSSDERVLQYCFEECLFRQRSPYQLVEIVKTVDFGNLLILDGYIQLAESDTVAYTQKLMNLPSEDYKDKEVLILGGGDGGLIRELCELSQPPEFVTMVDIDEVVMDACSKHMSKVCGTYLQRNNRQGSRHKIIAGDAIQFMENCIKSGKQFDYVFGDLTDVPVSTSEKSKSLWDFVTKIMDLGMQVTKPKVGKYMTHSYGRNAPEVGQNFEKVLGSMCGGNVTFEKDENFVPSFMETWNFYRVIRTD